MPRQRAEISRYPGFSLVVCLKTMNIRSILTRWLLSFGFLLVATVPVAAPVVRAEGMATCATSEVSFVAHQDDDILFMNPDIGDSIRAGHCVETVFITGGEWNGVPGSMTREQYAASRDEGTRAAYAAMAGVANVWIRRATQINGRNIEEATLTGAPTVKLLYLSIRDGNDDADPGSLQGLYQSTRSSITTLVPTGSPAGIVPVTYTKASLAQTALAIMTAYRATVLRTQDYAPNVQLGDNHPDHIFGALFAMEAAKSYRGVDNNLHVTWQAYRDYNIASSPVSLSSAQINQKTAVLSAYKAHDPIYELPTDQATLASRMYYRWSSSPAWAITNADGRLQAFDVQSGRLVTWQQDANKNWQAMQDLGNSMLQPGVGVGRNTNGTLAVFVIKQTITSQGKVQQSLQMIKQTTPGGGFSAWQDLGSPGADNGMYDISSPAVVANGDGRLEVFLKDSAGGLATIYQTSPSGGFSGWVRLGGSGLVEAPAAILRPDGRIEIYAATLGVMKHWLQREPNGAVQYDTAFTSVRATGTPSTGFNQDGRPEIFYRHAGDGRVFTTFETLSGYWFSGDIDLGGQSSSGAPTVASTLPVFQVGSRLALMARTAGGVDATIQGADNEAFQAWRSLAGSPSQHAPAAISDSSHAIHLLTISPDGLLSDHINP